MKEKIERIPDYNVKIKEYAHMTKIIRYREPVYVKAKKDQDKEAVEDVRAADNERSQEYTDLPRTEEEERHCISTSLNRTKNMIYDLAQSNEWDWFLTLTFNPAVYESDRYDMVVRYFKRFIDNIRKHFCPDLVYLFVPELHKDGVKYHLHGVINHADGLVFTDSGIKDDDGEPIYNLPVWKYGFSTASKIKDSARASSYITKYMTKETVQVTKGKHRYFASRNIKKPMVTKLMSSVQNEDIIRVYEPDNIKTVRTPVNSVSFFDVDD